MTNISYDVRANQEQLSAAKALFDFVGGNTTRATRIAINKAGPRVRTLSSSKIREQVNLKAGYVRDRLVFKRSVGSSLIGKIETPSRGILLSRYSTNSQVASEGIRWLLPPPTPPRGIKVKVKPGAGTTEVHGDDETEGKPFFVVLKNSRALGIAARLRGERRKFKVFHGPSLSQVFNDVRDDVMPQAADIYQEELIRAMNYVLRMQYPAEA